MGKGSKNIRGAFWLFILFFLITVRLTGQPSYIFHHLTTKDGLSNGNISAILKDSRGFLWIATQSGLNRYDGYGFKTYTSKPGIPNTMVSNNTWGLQEDGLGNIWISSNSYMVYNRDMDNFITDVPNFLKRIGIHVDRNYKIYVDKLKDFWVLSGQQAFFYDTHKKALKVFNIEVRLDEVITAELSDNGESLFAILKPGLLWQINKRSGRQNLIELPDNLNANLYSKLFLDYNGGLWLWSAKTDIICYRKDQSADWKQLRLKPDAKLQSYRVINFLDDENGHVWIGTDHNGIFIYNLSSGEITNLVEDQKISSSIASNNVASMYMDNNGIIWVGHSKKGLSYYHYSFHNIVNIEHPLCRDVSVILEDRQGRIWLGTDGNGLFLDEKKGDRDIQQLPIGNSPIVSLLEDRKGRVWIGTYSDGLYCYVNGKFSRFTTENSNLASNDIWSLKEDRYGNLWIGSLAGAVQCLRNGKEDLHALETLCEGVQHPLDMFYDNGDKLYVATVYGLYVIDIKTNNCVGYFGNKRATQSFNQNLITSVYKDKRDNIWLGHIQGLSLWDSKKDTIYYIDKANGLRDDVVHGIVEDDHQNLWVPTSNGLSVLFVETDSHGNLKVNCRNFTDKDGLSDNYFNNHAICKLRNGDILIGGTEGYSIINPNKMMEKNQPQAKVTFTGLSVENNSIEVGMPLKGRKMLEHPMELTHSLTFHHNDKLISIQFTTGDLLYADKVKYAYKLDGFHDQWQITPDNKIVFSSLAPGNYKLYVKACNSDDVWSDQVSILAITVKPPFYLSWWAITLYVLLLIGLVIFLVHRTRRKHNLKLEQQRILFERKQQDELNEMKLRFFTNISHDLRTPLTLILTPLQTILNGAIEDGLRKKLELINKSAGQLLNMISALLDFRKLDEGAETLRLKPGDLARFVGETSSQFHTYAVERRINLIFDNEIEDKAMQFDPDKIRKIILNLLSNAFKYTPEGGTIKIHIYRNGDNVNIAVSDSGQGIREADKPHVFERFYQAQQKQENTGSGIGLHIVNEYVRMHGGNITVEDNQPRGCVFIVSLPFRDADIPEELPVDTTEIEELIEQENEQILPSKPVLLFVDDNRELCSFMADSLADEYTVLLAYNGREALEQLQNNDINVVVSDVMMPELNGTELCKRIKTNIQWSHIPVILLTARTAEEYQLEGLELGADDYLTKPFNFNLLKLRVRKFLEWTEKCHRSFSQKLDVSPGEITITPLDEQLIGKAIKVVEDHISEPEFSVEELGAAVGLSRSHLYKKLMNITGKGPAEFIRTIRLKRGRQLLEKSQLQIAEIAYAVGFNSPKRFTINFKAEFGVSPSDYLRNKNNPE